ncbi:hypothetical protein ACE1TH_09865 [Shouchella sp. JSM 1781072]|uniref:hypothetical protein n=1 Tax=Bacillaceae TaxID=186817 RepID=UPI0020D0F728|nr:hypothetical protein [Alkalihalobacillus sp. LMS6]UTR07332.1 hypothetical protein MM326_04690 [Alkalihalobacillus sp. LMS6]
MGYGRNSYGYDSCGCGNYGSNNYGSGDCGCDTFFKNIARGEHVKVFLKGGDCVSGSFVSVEGNTVELANADCNSYNECKCDKKKVRIITICCDDIVAVEV